MIRSRSLSIPVLAATSCLALSIGLAGGCGSSVSQGNPGGAAATSGTDMTSGTSTGTVDTTGTGDTSVTGTTTGTGGATTGTTTGTGGAMTTTATGTTTSSSGGMGCPGTEPMNMSMCSMPGEQCPYPNGDQCDCSMGGTWRCHSCPATLPTDGTACMATTGFGAACTYGATQCDCANGMWQCASCPATAPEDMSMCTSQGLNCTYTDATCRCFGGGMMGATSWHCTTPCPTTEPAPGDMCMTGNQQCMYGNVTCLCMQGTFFCN